MPNLKNRKFTFGLYNSAQDPNHLEVSEAQQAANLDVDELALGNLRYKDYSADLEALPNTQQTQLNNRIFRILSAGSPTVQFEKNSGSSDWENLNDETYPVTPSSPNVVAQDGVNLTVNTGDLDNFSAAINGEYTANSQTWIIEIIDTGGAEDIRFQWKRISDVGWRVSNIEATFGVAENIESNVQVTFDSGDDYTAGNQSTVTVSSSALVDGAYSYIMVNVANTNLSPAVEVESLPSDPTVFVLDNVNDTTGEKQASAVPFITFESTLPTDVDDQWLFRKDPDTEDFVLVAKRSDVGTTYLDTATLDELGQIIVYEGFDDINMTDLLASAGATGWDRIFEKDNRIWLVPEGREDILFYSEQFDFWRWRTINSFSFQGDIRDIKFIKDNTVVGGEFTTVISTSNGIYHIVGNGTENAPYKQFTAVPDVVVQANSVVDLNGVLMLTTESTEYDLGNYGRKFYEYDLARLIEVSARAKNDSFFGAGTLTLTNAFMRGGDKYIAYASGQPRGLVYHRDAKALMPIDPNNSGWVWESKIFTLMDFERAYSGFARFFKFDYIGNVTFTLTVIDENVGDTNDFVLNLSSVTRREQMQRTPNLQGRKWKVKFEGTASTTLYDFYLVQ